MFVAERAQGEIEYCVNCPTMVFCPRNIGISPDAHSDKVYTMAYKRSKLSNPNAVRATDEPERLLRYPYVECTKGNTRARGRDSGSMDIGSE